MSNYNQLLLRYLQEASIRSVWERAAGSQSNTITDLSLGNPQFNPPESFFKALNKVIQTAPSSKFLAYMDNAGYLETRKAIAKDLNSSNFFTKPVSEENVIMTIGVSGGLNCVLHSILNKGDEVIILSPYFVDYPKYISNHGGVCKVVQLDSPEFDLNIRLIEKAISRKTKAIIINSPNNPTGKIYSDKKLKELANLLKKKNKHTLGKIYLISDEVYRDIVYDRTEFHSPCKYYSDSIMAYSFSKSLDIPGERIGYVAINPENEDPRQLYNLIRLATRTLGFTNAPALIQRMIPFLIPLKINRSFYQNKRAKLESTLRKAGFLFTKSEGTFYFFVKVPKDSKKFFSLLLSESLYVVPSKPFGVDGYFRIAFCVDDLIIKIACRKIAKIAKILSKNGTVSLY